MGSALAQNTKLIDIATGWPAGRGLCRKFLDSAAASFRPAGTRWRPFSAVRCSAPDKGGAITAPQGFSTYLNVLATASRGKLGTRVMSTSDPRNSLFYPVDPPRQQSCLSCRVIDVNLDIDIYSPPSHSARRKVHSDQPCLFGRGPGPI